MENKYNKLIQISTILNKFVIGFYLTFSLCILQLTIPKPSWFISLSFPFWVNFISAAIYSLCFFSLFNADRMMKKEKINKPDIIGHLFINFIIIFWLFLFIAIGFVIIENLTKGFNFLLPVIIICLWVNYKFPTITGQIQSKTDMFIRFNMELNKFAINFSILPLSFLMSAISDFENVQNATTNFLIMSPLIWLQNLWPAVWQSILQLIFAFIVILPYFMWIWILKTCSKMDEKKKNNKKIIAALSLSAVITIIWIVFASFEIFISVR